MGKQGHTCVFFLILVTTSFVAVTCREALYESPDRVVQRLMSNSHALDQTKLASQVMKALNRNTTPNSFLQALNKRSQPKSDNQLNNSSIFGNGNHVLSFSRETANTRHMSSDQCTADITAFVALLRYEEWALRMADAAGKPSAGILSGRFLFMGDFDECQKVVANYTPTGQQQERVFRGQFCTGKYRVNVTGVPPEGNYLWGICLPDSCDEAAGVYLANLALGSYNLSSLIQFESMLCHQPSVPLSSRAIAVVIVGGVMAGLVVVATLIDALFVRAPWGQHAKEALESTERFGREVNSTSQRDPLIHDYTHWRDDQPLILNGSPDASLNMQGEITRTNSRPGMALKIVLAFSALSNAEKLLSTAQTKTSLACVNGIRVISINWVVLGHTFLCFIYFGDNIGAYSADVMSRWSFQAIQNGTFSVDTFFVLSGLLVSYLTLTELARSSGRLNWLLFYIHRYLRLTPVYMMVLAIWVHVLPFMFDGPIFPQGHGFETDFCKDTWWGNLLYVQTLIKYKNGYCFGWGWYLAVDMQFYVLSPLFIIPLYRRVKLGYVVTGIFFLATIVTPFVLTETRYYAPTGGVVKGHNETRGDYNYDLYISPYCRMAPYLTGLLLGHLLYQRQLSARAWKLTWFGLGFGWTLACATALAVVYGLGYYNIHQSQMDVHLAAFYNALARPAWGLCIAWVVYSCVTGQAGIVDRFLGWRAWQPLARLTYTVYLVHFIVIGLFLSTARSPLYMNDLNVALLYMASLMGSYALAFVTSLLYEAPIMALEKVLLKKDKRD